MKIVRTNHVYVYHRHKVSGKTISTNYIPDINLPIPEGSEPGDDNFPKCPDCTNPFNKNQLKKNHLDCDCGSLFSMVNDDYVREPYDNYAGD